MVYYRNRFLLNLKNVYDVIVNLLALQSIRIFVDVKLIIQWELDILFEYIY